MKWQNILGFEETKWILRQFRNLNSFKENTKLTKTHWNETSNHDHIDRSPSASTIQILNLPKLYVLVSWMVTIQTFSLGKDKLKHLTLWLFMSIEALNIPNMHHEEPSDVNIDCKSSLKASREKNTKNKMRWKIYYNIKISLFQCG